MNPVFQHVFDDAELVRYLEQSGQHYTTDADGLIFAENLKIYLSHSAVRGKDQYTHVKLSKLKDCREITIYSNLTEKKFEDETGNVSFEGLETAGYVYIERPRSVIADQLKTVDDSLMVVMDLPQFDTIEYVSFKNLEIVGKAGLAKKRKAPVRVNNTLNVDGRPFCGGLYIGNVTEVHLDRLREVSQEFWVQVAYGKNHPRVVDVNKLERTGSFICSADVVLAESLHEVWGDSAEVNGEFEPDRRHFCNGHFDVTAKELHAENLKKINGHCCLYNVRNVNMPKLVKIGGSFKNSMDGLKEQTDNIDLRSLVSVGSNQELRSYYSDENIFSDNIASICTLNKDLTINGQPYPVEEGKRKHKTLVME